MGLKFGNSGTIGIRSLLNFGLFYQKIYQLEGASATEKLEYFPWNDNESEFFVFCFLSRV
jgi:hypothetical protein